MAYLINDEKTALIDTIEFSAGKGFVDGIGKHLEGKPLDYLIINHMELDHSGEIAGILEKYPQVQVVGNATTKRIFEAYFGRVENFLDIGRGGTVDLG